ncbi:MAG TPA: lipopolysaccharide heptosyltransferase I, partial [Coxiellaceae bacterium]|nr:lipopolysaccharide heptosyltransferase I [Coxiellaceae bacterium]
MRILLVKMSSMGDVIHTLPALTDALNANPNLKIDWLIEPAFADIPAWHPAVNAVIPVSLRHWRKNLLNITTWRDIKNVFKKIRSTQYDFIIDAQGLLKSALIAKIARGKIHGFNSNSARESLASFFYDQRYFIDKNQHAISRTRELFSKILHYPLSSVAPNYQIDHAQLLAVNFS